MKFFLELRGIAVTGLAFLCLAFVAPVAAETINCEGCSVSAMEERLWTHADMMPVPATDVLYVANVRDSVVRKWSINKYYDSPGECGDSGGVLEVPCVAWIDFEPLPVEEGVSLYVSFAQAYRDEIISFNPGSGEFPNDAYDAVLFPQKVQNVSNWLKTQPVDWLQSLISTINIVNPIKFFNPQAVSIPIRIHLPDGGILVMKWNPATQDYERVKSQTKDSSGNIVPETAESVSGGVGSVMDYNFSFNNEGLQDFLSRMSLLGVPVTGPMGTEDNRELRCSSRVTSEGRVVVQCVFI